MYKRPELLVSVASLDQLRYAKAYGADAVTLGLSAFSLRPSESGFGGPELELALKLCRHFSLKAYITVDIYLHHLLLESLVDFLHQLAPWQPDALILSDPAVLELAREIVPQIPLHLSALAQVTNWRSAQFWLQQGIKRIRVPTHLSWQELQALRAQLPEAELELQVHGPLFLAHSPYSLSPNKPSTSRCSTGGCRSRAEAIPEEGASVFRREENPHGTDLVHNKELCLLPYLPDLVQAGITSLGIEGFNRDLFCLAMMTHTYRQALDRCLDTEGYDPLHYLQELMDVSPNPLTSGLFSHEDNCTELNTQAIPHAPTYRCVGRVCEIHSKPSGKLAVIEATSKFVQGDTVEFVYRCGVFEKQLERFEKFDGETVSQVETAHFFNLLLEEPIDEFTFLRQKQGVPLSGVALAEQYLALVSAL